MTLINETDMKTKFSFNKKVNMGGWVVRAMPPPLGSGAGWPVIVCEVPSVGGLFYTKEWKLYNTFKNVLDEMRWPHQLLLLAKTEGEHTNISLCLPSAGLELSGVLLCDPVIERNPLDGASTPIPITMETGIDWALLLLQLDASDLPEIINVQDFE